MKGLLKRMLPKGWNAAKLQSSGEGYTILEVMIALTVSTALFISVALMLTGRQARAQFTQGVRTYEATIQNVASETDNGYYRTEFGCNVASGDYSYNFSGPANPGANVRCVFMGKVMVPHTVAEKTDVLTVVGRQFESGSTQNLASTIEASQPFVVPKNKGIDEDYDHKYGLIVESIKDPSGNEYQAFAYILPTTGGVANSSKAGSSSRAVLYGVSGSVGDNNRDSVTGAIHGFDPSEFYALPDGITICARSDATDLKAEIRVGSNNSQSGVISVIGANYQGDCA